MGDCLFYINILVKFLIEGRSTIDKTILKRIEQSIELKTLLEVFVCKHGHESITIRNPSLYGQKDKSRNLIKM